ncbi:MAG TPA: small, acid-soluble spore protein, H family [Bacillota bacterium]
MKSEKAKAVLESHGVISVLYRGNPVWIEILQGDQARITMIDTDQRLEVPVAELELENPEEI